MTLIEKGTGLTDIGIRLSEAVKGVKSMCEEQKF
jgi:hypothetical protein